VTTRLQRASHCFALRDLSQLLLAFAILGHQPPELFAVVAAEVQRRLPEMKPTSATDGATLSAVAFAFAVADIRADALFALSSDFESVCRRMPAEHLNLKQLHVWQLWRSEVDDAWPLLTDELRFASRAAFTQEQQQQEEGRACLEAEVLETLRSLEVRSLEVGVATRVAEGVPTRGGYLIPAVIYTANRRLAIEVESRDCFLCPGGGLTAAARFRRRHLLRSGYSIVPISYAEWAAPGHAAEAVQRAWRQRHVAHALARHGLDAQLPDAMLGHGSS